MTLPLKGKLICLYETRTGIEFKSKMDMRIKGEIPTARLVSDVFSGQRQSRSPMKNSYCLHVYGIKEWKAFKQAQEELLQLIEMYEPIIIQYPSTGTQYEDLAVIDPGHDTCDHGHSQYQFLILP